MILWYSFSSRDGTSNLAIFHHFQDVSTIQVTNLQPSSTHPTRLVDLRQLQGINPHPRFATLTGNIRRRRGDKVDIRVPLFRDARTPEFQQEEARETKKRFFSNQNPALWNHYLW